MKKKINFFIVLVIIMTVINEKDRIVEKKKARQCGLYKFPVQLKKKI